MKGTPLTLQQRRLLCKTCATADGALDDYFRLWRKGRELFPTTSESDELALTRYIEKGLAPILLQKFKDKFKERKEANK